MLNTMKAIFSLFTVILLSFGIIPVSSEVDYGGTDYVAPAVTTPMQIASNGETDWAIVTAPDADECTLTAVSELQTYLKKICGADFEHITEDNLPSGKKAIVLGKTALEKDITGVDRENIKADGFLLYSDGNYLLPAAAVAVVEAELPMP